MTASYHKRSNAAPARVKWALAFLVVCCAATLGGCSVSMPMAGLIDPAPTAAAASDVSGAASKEKPGVEVAAARPEL